MQRLWLFENKLTRLEGLSECGELRELCVQSNRIERIGSALNSTVHLESLALADNKVSLLKKYFAPWCYEAYGIISFLKN